MAALDIPENAVMVVLATDIETAGEHPVKDALMAIGVCVVAVCDNGFGPVVVAARRFGGFRKGSYRFSVRCADQYLTHANDESDDPSGWAARREQSKSNGYADLHTYPRVAPFAYDGGDCEHAHHGDFSSKSCIPCCNEIAAEHEAYKQWHAFRNEVLDECNHRNILFQQATDNGSFDHGWLLALSAVTLSCPPSYRVRDGECNGYIGTQETDLQISSMVSGYCLAKGIPATWSWPTYEILCKLIADDPQFFSLPPCPATHTHMPEDDATVIAWHYAVCWSLASGLYSKRSDPQ